MKATVADVKVKWNYAKGWVYSDTLTDEQRAKLGLDKMDEYAETVDVEIDFTVKYPYTKQHGGIEVTNVTAFRGPNKVDIKNSVKIDELEVSIEEEYL